MTDVPLHPSLHKLSIAPRRLLRLSGFLIFLVAAGTLLYLMVTAMTSGNLASLLMLGLGGIMILPLILVMGLVLRYLDCRLGRQMSIANQLLQRHTAINARLTPTGISNKQGTLMALHPTDQSIVPKEPLFALINPSFRWSRPPQQEINVSLYCPALQADNDIVALQGNQQALLGKLVSWQGYARHMQTMMGIMLLIIIITAGIPGYMAFKGYRTYQHAQQGLQWAKNSTHWLQASGTVQHNKLATAKISKGKIRVQGYRPYCTFAYTVADTVQQGDQLFFCNHPIADRQTAESWLKKYPVGQSITVYYNPDDPTQSVLEAGYTIACESLIHRAKTGLLFIGGLAVLLLLIIAIVVREYRKQRTLGLTLQKNQLDSA